ncbi:hypothetical protein DICPUDRAFT_79460 [Dictyostelium purpureum]|uniref:Uncharacterized protein n=1 Tax=Dictyostelium purpureum TaxID=5786 RepID=F0ZMN1_DICPU|nr:uncharacterized protein DICPUDRAFT_79460 [Dictyostelium purpureum]EGC34820.1 hypothetical protein DICPUDRAFT_79460 [Dictyostelium purpureum]|eukprot:XP_003288677.1 hypothetical protein DICPUDRAFT_79460 [Dictyostelium purpureum]
MPYIKEGGEVTQKRTKWRLSIVPEMFWYLLNQITYFFQTLLGNEVSRSSTIGGGKKPQKRMGGFGPSSGGPSGGGGGPSGGGGGGGGGGGRGPSGSGGSTNRRGDMKNILACNAASG